MVQIYKITTTISQSKTGEREEDACGKPPALPNGSSLSRDTPTESPATRSSRHLLAETQHPNRNNFTSISRARPFQSNPILRVQPNSTEFEILLQAEFTMRRFSTPLRFVLLLLLGFVLLPSSVSAYSGTDTAPPSSAVGSAPWATPAAIIATLRSLSLALQSLFTRLASARLARGDHAGNFPGAF